MMKIAFKRARCRVEYDYYLRGSVLKGTVEAGCTSFRSHFSIESDAPRERIAALIRNAKQGCFAEAIVQAPIRIESTIEHNGEPVPLEAIRG